MSRVQVLDGFTAYGIAVKNGFTGTEAEWLESLRANGNVNPVAADETMTIPVGADENGELFAGKDPKLDLIAADVSTLNGIVRSNFVISKQSSFDIVDGKSIYADRIIMDGVDIKTGRQYEVVFSAAAASFERLRLYERYADGTEKSITDMYPNAAKQLIASGDVVSLHIFMDSAWVTTAGNVDMHVSYISNNSDSLQSRMDEVERKILVLNGEKINDFVYAAENSGTVTNSAKLFSIPVSNDITSYKKGDCMLINVEIDASDKIKWLDHRFTWDDGTVWQLGTPTRDHKNPNQKASFVCTMILDKDRTLTKIANYCIPADENTESASYRASYRIEKVYSREDDIPLPDYYHESGYIESKADTINSYMDDCAANGDAFFFLTDIHWEQNAMRSPAILRYLRQHTGIDMVINGGDNYFGRPTTGVYDVTLALRDAVGDRVYLTDGNHEFAGYAGSELTYSAAFAPNKMHMRDVVYGSDERTYYYVDHPSNKMRYVFLQMFGVDKSASTGFKNLMQNDPQQLEWFTSTALNVELGWTIVIVCHCFYTFDSDGNPSLAVGAQAYADAINQYSGAGTIACVLSGHTHRDAIFRLGADGTGVPNILTTCDKFMRYDAGDLANGISREPHTISEQAVDTVIIDKINRSIKIVRVGAQAGEWSGNADAGTRAEVREITY